MPQLDKKRQQAVAKVGLPDPDGGFTILPDGLYLCRLTALTVLPAKEAGKFPQWQCEYTVIEDVTDGGTGTKHAGAKILDWLSMSDKEYPMQLVAEFFFSYGKSIDTNTDELLGSESVLEIGHSIRTQGKRKDQEGNDVLRRLPADFGIETGPDLNPSAEEGEEPF